MTTPTFVAGQLVRIVDSDGFVSHLDGLRAVVCAVHESGQCMVCFALSDWSSQSMFIHESRLQAIEPRADFHLPIPPTIDDWLEQNPGARWPTDGKPGVSPDDTLKIAQARALLRAEPQPDPRIAIAQALAAELVPMLISERITYEHRRERMTEVADLAATGAHNVLRNLKYTE